jgi:hypothetical protein
MLMSEYSTDFTVEIYNHQGMKLVAYPGRIDAGQVKVFDNVASGLLHGVYIVVVKHNDLTWTGKFKI